MALLQSACLVAVSQNVKILAIEIHSVTESTPTVAPLACIHYVFDFNKAADGTYLKGGAYICNQWGLHLSSSEGFGKHPHLFNTSNVGNELYGNSDLGTPNE
jgi:hypothetical protein